MEKTKRIDLRASQKNEKELIVTSKKLGTDTITDTIFKAVEMVATTELILIDRASIEQLDKLSEYARARLQDFITEFASLTGCSLTLQELEQTFAGVGALGSKVILESAISEMVRQKLYEKLRQKHPDMTITFDHIPQVDTTKLFEIAAKLDNTPTVRLGAPVTIFWGIYEIDSNKITINDQRLEALKQPYRKYATGSAQIEKLNKVRKLCQALDTIMEDKDISPEGIFRLVFWDKAAAKWMPTGAWITMNEQIPRILFTH